MKRSAWRFFLIVVVFLLAARLAVRAAEDALTRVRARGELRIATEANYPPFESVESGRIIGFDMDLATEIARELGVRPKPVNTDFKGAFVAVATGQYDVVMSGVTITDERKQKYAFSRPYFLSGQVIVRRKRGGPKWKADDAAIARPEDLLNSDRTVAVQQSTTGQEAVERLGMPADRIHKFQNTPLALLDVRNGKSDAFVGDLPALILTIAKDYPELEIVPGKPFVDENLGIVARIDARDLIAAINLALERIIADGRYASLYKKWMQEDVPPATLQRLVSLKEEGTPIPPPIQAKAEAILSGKPYSESDTDAASSGTASSLMIRPDVIKTALPTLLAAARMTVWLTLCAFLLGVPLGLLVALARLAHIPVLPALATIYVEVVRGTPLLVQIFIVYYILPAAQISLSPFTAGLTALALNAAAYTSEIFRAGIQSIDVGQREAARALGMSGGQTMQFVVLPQTVQRVLPPLTNEAIALLKDSSLVSAISLSELMQAGEELLLPTGAPVTIYFTIALIYLALTLPLTFLARYLERRWQPVSRPRLRTVGASGKGAGS
jgi:His/Glu/Gln/Arg/opine family amino acid ABC transporter permease subunit